MEKEREKRKLRKGRIIAIILVFSIVVLISAMIPNIGKAVTYSGFRDTISDSDPNASAQSVTHTFLVTSTQAITEDGYFELVFSAGFTDIASSNMTCPATSTPVYVDALTVRCLFEEDGFEATSTSIIITSTTNPSTTGSYTITLYSKASTTAEIENGTVKVGIIDDVSVSATVEATLTFAIQGLGTSTTINGVDTTGSSTQTTLAFGTIDSSASSTLGQRLLVTTNAASGFTVTVQQSQNLQTGGGADIDTFDDGHAASGTPLAWSSPAGTLGSEKTYGHFGLTAQDSSLSDTDPFGTALYKGFYGTTPIEVMYHTSSADGSTDEIGSSTVAYTIEITDLQEMGDYTSELTYICTPRY